MNFPRLLHGSPAGCQFVAASHPQHGCAAVVPSTVVPAALGVGAIFSFITLSLGFAAGFTAAFVSSAFAAACWAAFSWSALIWAAFLIWSTGMSDGEIGLDFSCANEFTPKQSSVANTATIIFRDIFFSGKDDEFRIKHGTFSVMMLAIVFQSLNFNSIENDYLPGKILAFDQFF